MNEIVIHIWGSLPAVDVVDPTLWSVTTCSNFFARVGIDSSELSEPDKLYWAIQQFDDAGFYFRNPSIAKNNSREELDQCYRDTLDTMWIASMTGQERAEIKEKKKNKEEEERKPWTWKKHNFHF